MNRRLLLTFLMILFIGVAAGIAVFLAKGYRFSTTDRTIAGTGILSITSIPDQASIYLDGHLTSATNTNINSLSPKKYNVKISKEGFIPWEKEVEVKEGLVSEIKATLYRSIPTVYPLTYLGVQSVLISPDGQKLLYVVPKPEDQNTTGPADLRVDRNSGVWVWEMADRPISFGRGAGNRQVARFENGIDYTKAQFRWSPDSRQILVNLPERKLLIESDRFNDPPRDITALVTSTLKTWDQDQKEKDQSRLEIIKDLNFRKIASNSASLKWSPDESKLMYQENGQELTKVIDLETKKTYELPEANFYNWLPDSEHLYLVESETEPSPVSKIEESSPSGNIVNLKVGKISVVEFDGFNKSEIYAGSFDPNSVIVWPDGSRLIVVSTFPTATAQKPNLYGINLK